MKPIDKDALVAEIDSCIRSLEACLSGKMPIEASLRAHEKCEGKLLAYKKTRDIIDTLEVKAVDLAQEIDRELERRWRGEYLYTQKFRESAKHFFELGLKAQR